MSIERQTPKRDFGDRVRAGLASVDLGGGIDTDGDCAADINAVAGTGPVVHLRNENTCDDSGAPWYRRPFGASENTTPYFIRGDDGEMLTLWLEDIQAASNKAPDGTVLQGASLVGGALPGGSIISAAVSSVYVLNAHKGNAPAALKTAVANNPAFQSNANAGQMVRLKASEMTKMFEGGQQNGAYVRARRDFEAVVGGNTQTFEVGALYTGPCKPPYLCDDMYGQDILIVVAENMTEGQNVFKTKHDTAKNSIGNIRGFVVLGSTTQGDTNACIQAFDRDTTCVMGAARVQAGVHAAAGVVANGARLLHPPKWSFGATSPTFSAVENALTTFTWTGTSPVYDPSLGGYAIIAAGEAMGGSTAKRSLFFVNTSVSPWTATGALSN